MRWPRCKRCEREGDIEITHMLFSEWVCSEWFCQYHYAVLMKEYEERRKLIETVMEMRRE